MFKKKERKKGCVYEAASKGKAKKKGTRPPCSGQVWVQWTEEDEGLTKGGDRRGFSFSRASIKNAAAFVKVTGAGG